MNKRPSKLAQYAPLVTIIGLAALGSIALSRHEGYSMDRFMHLFMGLFLLQFSALKLFDVRGFAKGFAKYDLLAMRSRPYGLIYPFLELTLALGYLAGGAIWIYMFRAYGWALCWCYIVRNLIGIIRLFCAAVGRCNVDSYVWRIWLGHWSHTLGEFQVWELGTYPVLSSTIRQYPATWIKA